MISCTEFIPAYSTLFTYLEETFGPEAVPDYWGKHFDFKKHALYHFLEKEGLHGCWSYWKGTLNEEAADFTMYLNEKRGFYMIKMHRCPSKGRLLEMQSKIGVPPYRNYCLHCDYYRASAEACGFQYIYNFEGTDHAACSLLIYDPKLFDGRVIIDDDTLVMDRKASDNEYFHKAFHNSLNKGINFLGTYHGENYIRAYLTKFASTVYRPVIEDIQVRGLAALRDKILDTYEKEHAPEAVSVSLCESALQVKVAWCPAVKYLHEAGMEVNPWFSMSTEVVMSVLAEQSGYHFSMDHYDPETGAADYHFWK